MVNYSTINRIYQADNNIREVMQVEVKNNKQYQNMKILISEKGCKYEL
jgi:hypothetical protein